MDTLTSHPTTRKQPTPYQYYGLKLNMLQPQDHIDITDCGTVFVTLSPELLRQGGTIEIIAQTIMPGDAIILESNRRLPSGTVINIDTDYIPAPNIMRQPNTDTIHQPLPQWPKKTK